MNKIRFNITFIEIVFEPFVVNWLSSLFSFGVGLTILSMYLLIIVFRLVTSKLFRRWAWEERNIRPMVIYALSAIVGAILAMGLVGFSQWNKAAERTREETKKQPSPTPASPPIIITGPLIPANKPDPRIIVDDSQIPDDISSDLKKLGININNTNEKFDPMKFILPGAMKVYLGNSLGCTTATSGIVIRIVDRNVLTIRRGDNGLFINAEIFGRNGKILASIKDNVIFINEKQEDYLRSDRPDQHTLLIYDQYNDVVLDVEFVNSSSIKIKGVFRYSGRELLVSEKSMMLNGQPWLAGCIATDCKEVMYNIK